VSELVGIMGDDDLVVKNCCLLWEDSCMFWYVEWM